MIATASLGSFVVNLGPAGKIPAGQGRVFQIGGNSIAVFHTLDGDVYATEPTCPHKDCPLTHGFIGAKEVVCPHHGVAFDLNTGLPQENSCRALKTFPATLNDQGEILIGIEQLLAGRLQPRKYRSA